MKNIFSLKQFTKSLSSIDMTTIKVILNIFYIDVKEERECERVR